ncbi:MAG: DUF4019 domain-containing protein [Proteobacteria bacterium]|nr:DUF4019 domain-containing protein [Pseudomonadota bacterium]
MAHAIDTLTDKEKQTLRLLLVGYDAKSMARHLGLSVHTINERLRDARRKLETSSSREAARLLREAEAQTPERLGDDDLGDAAEPAPGARPGHQPSKAAAACRPGWAIGGIAMLVALTLAALASFSDVGQIAQPAAETTAGSSRSAAETEAAAAARHWLELVDARDWKACYDLTGSAFRAHNTLDGWTAAALGVHGKFGPARSRVLVSVDETPAPPAGNVVVKFRATYANKPTGTELLTLVREDGAWKVSGIYVD